MSYTSRFSGKGEQLKMFMTPKEIHEKYQPLDGDREDVYNEDGRTGESTMRPRSTGGGRNDTNYNAGKVHDGNSALGWGDYANKTNGIYTRDINATAKMNADYSRRSKGSSDETDEQLWDRKYEEAEYDRRASITVPRTGGSSSSSSSGISWGREASGPPASPGFRKEEVSLAEAINREGIKSPIRLGNQFGSMGKPQIVGGHHRLAVATRDMPNTLIPVLHDEDIHDARSPQNRKAGFGYT
jgi:hypothetical protein